MKPRLKKIFGIISVLSVFGFFVSFVYFYVIDALYKHTIIPIVAILIIESILDVITDDNINHQILENIKIGLIFIFVGLIVYSLCVVLYYHPLIIIGFILSTILFLWSMSSL